MNRIRGSLLITVAAFSAIAFAPGCQHDETTDFAPGLTSVEAGADVAVLSYEVDAAAYPETLSLQQGSDSISNYVNATGYVDAPIADVWAAFQIPNVVVNRTAINSYTVTNNVETGYAVSFATTYTVNNVVTVTFTLTWREGIVAGTDAAPTGVSVDYEKTDGSSFVSLMKGSIELVAVAENVTQLTFAQRMNAENTDSTNIASWTNEMFSSVVAQVHGQPLPP